MNIIILKEKLKEALDVVSRATGENTHLPILKNILLSAEDGKISFTGTNLEIAATYTITSKVIEKGSVAIPAYLFLNLISNIQNDRIQLSGKENSVEIKTDSYQATIKGSASEEFPIIPKLKQKNQRIELNGAILKNALEQTIIATQFSDLRPELNSILFQFSLDSLRLAATDSFRLAEKTIPASQLKTKIETERRILLPLKTAQELVRVIREKEDVFISFDENQILFETGPVQLISRLIEGTFPDYHAVIPKKFSAEITIDREELLRALKLTGVLGNRVSEIHIRILPEKKAIEILSEDVALGENKYLIPAKIKGSAKELYFNWRYVADGLKVFSGEEIFFGLNEDNKPALIRNIMDASYFYIVMPVLKA